MTDKEVRDFRHIESQMSLGDKRSLLDLRDLVAQSGPFSYLEVGSHLGGSLQPFVVDDRCTAIFSIDPRPPSQPDNRLPKTERYRYEDNSTERMLSLLNEIPEANIDKIKTFEADTKSIDPSLIGPEPALCLIDGEHTDVAALQDALFCAAAAPRSVVAFHDRGVIGRGIGAFMRVIKCYGHSLPDSLFVVDLTNRGRAEHLQRHPMLWRMANTVGIAGEIAALGGSRPARMAKKASHARAPRS